MAGQKDELRHAPSSTLTDLPSKVFEAIYGTCNRASRRALRLTSTQLLRIADGVLAHIAVAVNCSPCDEPSNGLVIRNASDLHTIQRRFPMATQLCLVEAELHPRRAAVAAARLPAGAAVLAAALAELPDGSWPDLTSYTLPKLSIAEQRALLRELARVCPSAEPCLLLAAALQDLQHFIGNVGPSAALASGISATVGLRAHQGPECDAWVRVISQLRGLRTLELQVSAVPTWMRFSGGCVNVAVDSDSASGDDIQECTFLADAVAPLMSLTRLCVSFSCLKPGLLPALGACDRLRELVIISSDGWAAAPLDHFGAAVAAFPVLTRLEFARCDSWYVCSASRKNCPCEIMCVQFEPQLSFWVHMMWMVATVRLPRRTASYQVTAGYADQ